MKKSFEDEKIDYVTNVNTQSNQFNNSSSKKNKGSRKPSTPENHKRKRAINLFEKDNIEQALESNKSSDVLEPEEVQYTISHHKYNDPYTNMVIKTLK
jgi:hypothetical protein